MAGKVYFVGAGPGDPELITIKGKKIIDNADVVIYAGIFVNHKIVSGLNAKLYDSSIMTFEEIIRTMKDAVNQGKTVVRLHSGDTSIYSTISEQIDMLRELGIEYEIIPGVSSLEAGAAVLGQELTIPDISETIILTRVEVKAPMPKNEKLSELAKHRTSMILFFSEKRIEHIREELLKSYPENTPVVVIEKVSWPEQKIVRGTLKDITAKIKDANIERPALIYVGDVLKVSEKSIKKSKFYSKRHQ